MKFGVVTGRRFLWPRSKHYLTAELVLTLLFSLLAATWNGRSQGPNHYARGGITYKLFYILPIFSCGFCQRPPYIRPQLVILPCDFLDSLVHPLRTPTLRREPLMPLPTRVRALEREILFLDSTPAKALRTGRHENLIILRRPWTRLNTRRGRCGGRSRYGAFWHCPTVYRGNTWWLHGARGGLILPCWRWMTCGCPCCGGRCSHLMHRGC